MLAESIADGLATITEIRLSGNRITLRWKTDTQGVPQTVETRDSLTSGAWKPISGIQWPQVLSEFTDPHAVTEGVRYYRVVAPSPVPDRGRILSVKLHQRLTRSSIQLVLALAGVELAISNDINFYQVEYQTVGPSGEPSTASGGMAVPEGVLGPLPLVSYQHGTELKRSEVPSSLNTEALIAVAMAGTGYLSLAPDYLGLGTSSFPYHPYHHAKTEATAVVDLLRAARLFASRSNIALSGSVFLFGYSQGGHATLAAHREIEQFHAAEFQLKASAPGAGAYDLSGVTTDDVLSERPQPNPYYFAYLLAAYQRIYGIAESLPSVFKAPYNLDIPPLLDGFHSGSDVNAKMPRVPTQALNPEYLTAFKTDPDHPLRQALKANDLLDWVPVAPVRLFHCQDDQDVLFANSQKAWERLKANGAASVELRNGGAFDHGGCVPFSLLGAKSWFDSLK